MVRCLCHSSFCGYCLCNPNPSPFHSRNGPREERVWGRSGCCRPFCTASGRGERHRQGSTQRICRRQRSFWHITVAYCEYFIFAVDICNLMNEPVLFAFFKNFKSFLFGDIYAAFVGFHNIIGHIAHGNAPALLIIGAALIKGFAAAAAGAGALGVFAFIFIKPV